METKCKCSTKYIVDVDDPDLIKKWDKMSDSWPKWRNNFKIFLVTEDISTNKAYQTPTKKLLNSKFNSLASLNKQFSYRKKNKWNDLNKQLSLSKRSEWTSSTKSSPDSYLVKRYRDIINSKSRCNKLHKVKTSMNSYKKVRDLHTPESKCSSNSTALKSSSNRRTSTSTFQSPK